jgi:hypothetical protein
LERWVGRRLTVLDVVVWLVNVFASAGQVSARARFVT